MNSYERNFSAGRDRELDPVMQWLPRLYRAAAKRTGALEHQASKKYPGIFDLLDRHRQAHAQEWPSWCWMPIGRVFDIVEAGYPALHGRPSGLPAEVLALRDSAVLAAIGAWRAAGRASVNFHDSLMPQMEARANRLPRDLPGRWPVPGVYMTSESPHGADGVFLHLEWDEKEQRTEFRQVQDMQPKPRFDDLFVQPMHMVGKTITDALEATWAATFMKADQALGQEIRVPVTGADTELRGLAAQQARHVGVFVAAADILASAPPGGVDDAAAVLERADGAEWPPRPDGSSDMRLWLVPPGAALS
ncbi:hypothetical protein ACPC54_30600 [Kitasatospora sp. NPDC094028]